MTKLEKYLKNISKEEENEGFYDYEKFKKELDLNNKYKENRLYISPFILLFTIIPIIVAVIATELENKAILVDSLIVLFSLIAASSIALKINKTLSILEREYKNKEWKEYTTLENISDGFFDSISSVIFLIEETTFLKRLSVYSEENQIKFLKRTLSIEGF